MPTRKVWRRSPTSSGTRTTNRAKTTKRSSRFARSRASAWPSSKQVTVGPKPLWLSELAGAEPFQHRLDSPGERRSSKTRSSPSKKSLDYRSALVDSHPSVTEYKVKPRRRACREIANVQHEAHQDAKAFQSIQRSIDVLKALVRAQPDQAGYHGELGLSWNYLGFLYDDARKNTEALPAFEQAVAEQQLPSTGERVTTSTEVSRQSPRQSRRAVRRPGPGRPGVAVLQAGDPDPPELLTTHPGQRFYLLDLADALSTLGNIDRHAGDSTAARASFSDARSLLERAAAATPDDGALQVSARRGTRPGGRRTGRPARAGKCTPPARARR